MPDSKLAAVCTHPDGDGVWFPVDRIGEPCPDSGCGDCQPVYYVAASAIEQFAERMKRAGLPNVASGLKSILNEQGGGNNE